jgi:urease accessory protein
VVGTIRAGWDALNRSSRPFSEPSVDDAELATVSQLDGVLVGRYRGPSTARARRFFTLAWSVLRPVLLERPPCLSRFWNT